MNKWFRKGNSRRFHRVNMPVRYFIVPSSPIKDREIYATGADYFPQSFLNVIETRKHFTNLWVSRIQEQNALLTEIFDEIISFIEFFGNCSRAIAEGRNPKSDPSYWMSVNEHLKGFQSTYKFQASSPKTFQYLKMIEEKYLSFLNSMVNSINQSTPTHFHVIGHLPVGFKMDEMMMIFDSEKFKKIPLIQAISYVCQLLNAYLETYRQINDDNYFKQFPTEWPVRNANVSASGIAVNINKRFPQYSRVDVYLYFESDKKVLYFNGSVVDMRTDPDGLTERVAINYEFPDGNHQNYIQQEIQKQEVKECMDIPL
ncbi:PilZ domain-containing protein [Thiomicrorhabdus aquaedulcis]|uniref:PilZ domain-containing protein n=1 Tax=Thiomicrorhabdus aquaedulcis TaxID=2211106 RepID=UPI000FDC5EBB|nr:PilZ domain-containing protein [Thiomicrorhabdus aquaedulcis]